MPESGEFDRTIRRIPRLRDAAFVHRRCVPLDEVNLSNAEDRGQLALGFADECEGLCGN